MGERHIVLRARGKPFIGRIGTRDAAGPGAGPAGLPGQPGSQSADALLEAAATMQVEVVELSRAELAELQADPEVQAEAPPMPLALIAPVAQSVPAAAELGEMAWGVAAVGADRSPFDGRGAVVAVLDTGIDPGHPAFAGVTLERRNFTTEPDDDMHGHGTHCAGTIFGRSVDGTRIGIAPGVQRALIGKVLGAGGGGSAQLVEAIDWAVRGGAHVVSMSLGIDFPGYVQLLVSQSGWPIDLATSRALDAYRRNVMLFERMAALLRARDGTHLVVAAAGNESRREQGQHFEIGVSPPAVAEGIVAVGALGRQPNGLGIADFSNTGPNLCAPGVGVISAARAGGLTSMDGTSMATPHVAGVAALWVQQLAQDGMLNSFNLLTRLVGTASFNGLRPGIDRTDTGAGMVRAPQ